MKLKAIKFKVNGKKGGELLTVKQFAEEAEVSKQSIQNYIKQDKLDWERAHFIWTKNRELRYQYFFTRNQIQQAKDLAQEYKIDQHTLGLCLADSVENLTKIEEAMRIVIADKKGFYKIEKIDAMYEKMLDEEKLIWMESEELKDLIEKQKQEKLEQEITLAVEVYKENVDKTKLMEFDSYRSVMEEFQIGFIRKLREEEVQGTEEEIVEKYKLEEFFQCIHHLLEGGSPEKYDECVRVILESGKNTSDMVKLIHLFVDDIERCYKNFSSLQNNLKKQKEDEVTIIRKRYMSEQEAEDGQELFGQKKSYIEDYKEKYYVVGDQYSKIRKEGTKEYLKQKRKELLDKERLDSSFYLLKKVLTTDKDNMNKLFMRIAQKEFAVIFISENGVLDDNTRMLLTCLCKANSVELYFV